MLCCVYGAKCLSLLFVEIVQSLSKSCIAQAFKGLRPWTPLDQLRLGPLFESRGNPPDFFPEN